MLECGPPCLHSVPFKMYPSVDGGALPETNAVAHLRKVSVAAEFDRDISHGAVQPGAGLESALRIHSRMACRLRSLIMFAVVVVDLKLFLLGSRRSITPSRQRKGLW